MRVVSRGTAVEPSKAYHRPIVASRLDQQGQGSSHRASSICPGMPIRCLPLEVVVSLTMSAGTVREPPWLGGICIWLFLLFSKAEHNLRLRRSRYSQATMGELRYCSDNNKRRHIVYPGQLAIMTASLHEVGSPLHQVACIFCPAPAGAPIHSASVRF
jgi:hypothetical protein